VAWLIQRNDRGARWYVCFRTAGGREVRRAAGRSRRSAERILAKVETEVQENKFFNRELRSTWTLGRLSEIYLERLGRIRPRSARWRREMYRQLLQVLGEDLPIEEIELATLDQYVSKRRGQGKAPSTINREISVLRHSLHLAARWRTETNLSRYRLAEWEPLREAQSARQATFLSGEQVARLLANAHARAAEGTINERQGEAVIRLALETGARLGEILGLAWDDLDGNGILRVRTEKNGPDRWIQLAEPTVRLIETFRDHHGGCGLIFRSPVTGLKRGDVRRFWRWVKKKAKVEHIRFHDLRHTAASEMLRRGVLLREVQYVLGHSSARMTERYAHFAPTFKAPKALSW
jgi:integrase